MRSRPVKPRATRMACIVASVPGDRHPRHVAEGHLADELRHRDLVLAGQAEADATAHPLVDMVVHAGVGVAQDGRAVAHAQVHELVAVEVPDPAHRGPGRRRWCPRPRRGSCCRCRRASGRPRRGTPRAVAGARACGARAHQAEDHSRLGAWMRGVRDLGTDSLACMAIMTPCRDIRRLHARS